MNTYFFSGITGRSPCSYCILLLSGFDTARSTLPTLVKETQEVLDNDSAEIICPVTTSAMTKTDPCPLVLG
ncbi:hypothetical protein ASPSYDRAFT_303149 [Aspergillus sydowii CBS 593.65]|uniref:Uncharacterized protein n=1 Tax=Aspergillus sydowii CBS 593.65 TaxID=1036612 RepID=A0A1L9TY09_9EURO|nr:uncharacterized protein ASPSYDRAFT_303149 [Aspergillus sydowii CBS 593.65]OJJ64326.1 hypothetical protein ASPSYDRAFT_303149 [Aspergillus sydowii CBS 593.65]